MRKQETRELSLGGRVLLIWIGGQGVRKSTKNPEAGRELGARREGDGARGEARAKDAGGEDEGDLMAEGATVSYGA